MTDDAKAAVCPLMGLLAVRNNLISKVELENGLRDIAGAQEPEEALKNYFLSNELISAQNIQRLARIAKTLEIRKKEYTFGAIAIKKGFINQSLLNLVLEEQKSDLREKKKPRRIGDMLVESGLMSAKQRDHILKLQNRLRKEPSSGAPKLAEDCLDAKAAVPEMKSVYISDGGILLQVDGEAMGAFMTKTDTFDEDIDAQEIKAILLEMGIVSGLVSDALIQGFIRSSGYRSKPFRVAKGNIPVDGRDGKIEYFFNTDYLRAGGIDAEGNIDFKERGEVPHVEAGTVLAEKTPMVPCRQGLNIYGEPVATAQGNDVHLRLGHGAVLSEDGLKVLAGVKGYPRFSLAGVICVNQTYTAPGDVDYETGHIEYDGNVRIIGSIKSGFKVQGNDIEAKSLDGGIVEADGDLVVAGGIVEGDIYARGNVFARFIHKSKIVCMGNVVVTKEVVDSTIECAGCCAIEYGKLISANVTAKMGILAQNVGTQMADPCVLQVGLDSFIKAELSKIRGRKLKAKEVLEKLNRGKEEMVTRRQELQEKITQLAHAQDRCQLDLSRLRGAGEKKVAGKIKQLETEISHAEGTLERYFDRMESLDNSLKQLETLWRKHAQGMDELAQERQNLTLWSRENPGSPRVMVKGMIHSGTLVRGRHSSMVLDEALRYSKIVEMEVADEGESEAASATYRMVVAPY